MPLTQSPRREVVSSSVTRRVPTPRLLGVLLWQLGNGPLWVASPGVVREPLKTSRIITCPHLLRLLSQAGSLCVSSAFGKWRCFSESAVLAHLSSGPRSRSSKLPRKFQLIRAERSSNGSCRSRPALQLDVRRVRFVNCDQRGRRNDLLRLDVVDFHAFQAPKRAKLISLSKCPMFPTIRLYFFFFMRSKMTAPVSASSGHVYHSIKILAQRSFQRLLCCRKVGTWCGKSNWKVGDHVNVLDLWSSPH